MSINSPGSDPRIILEQGVREGLHRGAQLCVMQRGRILLDYASGEARSGVPMRTDSVVPWFSTGKPLIAIAIAQLHEQGDVSLDQPVAQCIPEFAQGGKEQITLRHVLTHTAGIRRADRISADLAWPELIEKICETEIEENWTPSERAGYSTLAGWNILGEVIQRVTGTPCDEYLKRELLDPLGMNNTSLRLTATAAENYHDRLALMHDTSRTGNREPTPGQDTTSLEKCRPGSSARGPVRELVRFYQMLLDHGSTQNRQFLKPETIEHFTARHRAGLYDETFLHKLDFGLGFILNSNRYGEESVPYGYGSQASENTYGHSGAQSSCAFADPARELIVAWATNGMPGEQLHQKRQRAINNAVYAMCA